MKKFKDYDLNQPLLISPDLRDWLPDDHLAKFISELIESLDLTPFYDAYNQRSRAGQPPRDPRLMLKILVYGYSLGIRSSRRLERATYEDVAFRFLSADQHPDHDVIAHFRKQHQEAFSDLFLEVLRICQESGLVKLGHVSLDGTKVKANANKSKSRRYDQLLKSERELEREIAKILDEAEATDASEDKIYGKRRKEKDLPEHLRDKKKRLETIRRVISQIENEASDKRQEYREEKKRIHAEDSAWMVEHGRKFERRPPKNMEIRSVSQSVAARRNPTDYDSRIMKDHQTGGFIQAYNCQMAVDDAYQVIVAVDVVNQTSDKKLLPAMAQKIVKNCGVPKFLTADSGYFSERDIYACEKLGIDPYVPPDSKAKGKRVINEGHSMRRVTITEYMRNKLNTITGKRIYRIRKTVVEPVFGQYKAGKNFRQFVLRGQNNVRIEWELMAIAHNIGKLHRCRRF